jgi:uncharacterized membrane protein
MKISARTEWPLWTLIAAMFLASAVAWPMVPERFPMHFNLHGQVDHWGTRSEAPVPLLILPATGALIYVLMLFLPTIDPGRANYDRFRTVYWVIRSLVLGHFAVLHVTVLLITLGYTVDIARIALLSAGILLLVLGSILGKIRPNWFVGVRTPWTLSSKLSWTHSQRAGGWTFLAWGLLAFAAAFLPAPWNIAVFLGAIILGSVALVVYSYLVWRRDPDRVPPSGTTPADNESTND